MNAVATTAPKFTSRPRTVVAVTGGRPVNLGTYANYFLAEPVARAAAQLKGVTAVEMLIHLPAAE